MLVQYVEAESIRQRLNLTLDKRKVSYVTSGGVDEEDLVTGALREAQGCALLDSSGFHALASCTFSLSWLMQTELSLNSEWLMKCRSDQRQTIESRSEPFITLKANASARAARWMMVLAREREEKKRSPLSSPHKERSESPLWICGAMRFFHLNYTWESRVSYLSVCVVLIQRSDKCVDIWISS